jgi:16S rRNA (uracil1498-N3)-methyltransferase
VLRLRPGQRVRVFDGQAEVDQVVELRSAEAGSVVGTVAQAPEPRTHLVAYPTLLQRDKFEAVVQKLVEVGAAAIVPVLSERSLVRSAPEPARLQRWQAIATEAAEQSGRGRVPAVCPAVELPVALAQALAEGSALVACPGAGSGLRQALCRATPPIGLFVGPEGGYTADEVRLAQARGARLVQLGPRILRTETASPILAALVLYERDERDERGDLSSEH